jgi:hypothetical protein
MMKFNLRQLLPLIALLGLTLYVSGRVNADIAAREIPHAPDWDGTAPKLITGTAAPNIADRPYIDIAPNGNKLIIVYNRRLNAGGNDPYFSQSTNGGQTWSSPAPIYSSPGVGTNSLEVNLAIDANGTGHAVWVESDSKILYAKQSNWGGNSPTTIDGDVNNIQTSSPRIIASGNNTLDVIWTATKLTGLTRVWHRRSTNGGNSWGDKSPISPATVEALFTDFAVDGNGNLNVVWEQTDTNNPQTGAFIHYRKGTVSGSTITWSTPIRIGDVSADPDGNGPIPANGRSARRPIIVAADGRLHVAFTTHWQDASQWVHFVACSSACQNISNWSDDTPVSGTVVGVNANSPKYIVSDIFSVRGCIHIYFHGIDSTLQNNELILGVNSCDNWASFGRDQVTEPQLQSLHTSSVLTEEFIHMVYEQTGNQGSTRQIYYRRGLPPPFTLYLPFAVKD